MYVISRIHMHMYICVYVYLLVCGIEVYICYIYICIFIRFLTIFGGKKAPAAAMEENKNVFSDTRREKAPAAVIKRQTKK